MKLLLIIIISFISGCASKKPLPAPTLLMAKDNLLQPSVRNILDRRCIGCHSGDKPAGRLNLSSYKGVMTPSMRGGMVKNGDSENSPLIKALLGTWSSGQMPSQQQPLEWKEIKAIRRWIDSGASLKGFEERFRMSTMGSE